MSTAPTAMPGTRFRHDAFISHAPEDQRWAISLQHQLGAGLLTVSMADQPASASRLAWGAETLDRSRALVVLWSQRAVGSEAMGSEIAHFLKQDDPARPRPIVAIELGTTMLGRRDTRPLELVEHQWLRLDEETYAAGPEAAGRPWQEIAERIAQALAQVATTPIVEPLWLHVIDGGRQVGWAWTLSAAQAVWSIVDGPALTPPAIGSTVLLRSPYAGMLETQVLDVLGANPGSHDGCVLLALPSGLHAPALSIGLPADEVVQLLPPERRGVRGTVATSPRGERFIHPARDGEHVRVGSPIVSVGQGCVIGVLGGRFGGRPLTLAPLPPTWHAETDPQDAVPPSARVHTDAWTTEDKLDYALYAKAIEQFIRHRDTRPPLVISVQGPWGQGKTSLMRMVQQRLDPDHPDLLGMRTAPDPEQRTRRLTFGDLLTQLAAPTEPTVEPPDDVSSVWFNAWKYQSSETLWAGLVDAVLQQLPGRLPRFDRELFWLRLQRGRFDTAALRRDVHRLAFERVLPLLVLCAAALCLVGLLAAFGAISDAVGAIGGASAIAVSLLSWIGANAWARKRPLEGRYARWVRQPDYTERAGFLHAVEQDLQSALALLVPPDRPLVVFIDDLDRCAPAKIGEVLEAINLFLSGDYPDCLFVLGIDAEVVAAAMEVVHRDVIDRLEDRRGELGWRFMDKFVQLSFVMPRLSRRQREDFVEALLSASAADAALLAEARQAVTEITDELNARALAPSEAVRRIGEIDPAIAAAAPDDVRRAAEAAIVAGAEAFDDSDEEMADALRGQLRFLSNNPRTIKRAVNLYRFYRFIAWARQASPLGLEAADPELISRWIVVAVRWPSFVRWLQANAVDGSLSARAEAIVRQARGADSYDAWRAALSVDGRPPWHAEGELWSFLHDGDPALDLARAAVCGLW